MRLTWKLFLLLPAAFLASACGTAPKNDWLSDPVDYTQDSTSAQTDDSLSNVGGHAHNGANHR